MISAADRMRLSEIDQEQMALIRRLTELRREEQAILGRKESLPTPPILVDRRREKKPERVSTRALTAEERNRRKKEREKARAAYFRDGFA